MDEKITSEDIATNRKMVYYHPFPLEANPMGGIRTRSLRMLEAFQALGLEVEVIIGNNKQRKLAIQHIRRKVKLGISYDFIYVEDISRPIFFIDGRWPQWSLRDLRFFLWMKRKKVTIAWFYRDARWALRDITYDYWSPAKHWLSFGIFFADLYLLRAFVTRFYLPSNEMAKILGPLPVDRIRPLPPGHSVTEVKQPLRKKNQKKELRLIYVGGLGSIYEIHEVVEAISELPNVHLTICTREQCWMAVKEQYPLVSASPNIEVQHLDSNEIAKLYTSYDLALLTVRNNRNWSFAAPLKLYEYIGNGIPIIATKQTLAGRYIAENNLGWVVDYHQTEIKNLLHHLLNDQLAIDIKRRNIVEIAKEHTWQCRAKSVIDDMTTSNHVVMKKPGALNW